MSILNIIVYCALLSGFKCAFLQRSDVGERARGRQLIANWGSWHAVRQCSVSCGGEGLIERERECSTGVRQDCLAVGGDYYEVNVCNEGPCATGPINWLEWTANTACSASCDGGFQESSRECSTGRNSDCEAAQGGRYWKADVCNQKPCSPIWGSWHAVGHCSVSCGGQGFITRERNCSTGIRQDCLDAGGDYNEVNVCNEPCVTGPTHWLEWTATTACDASCDGGIQQSNRECSTGRNRDCEAHGGRSWKIDVCNQKPCSRTWYEWGPFSTCPKTCDTGVTIRRRNCSSGVNSDCAGQSYELQPCKLADCIITTTTISPKTTKTPPSWSEWQSAIACSTTCGPGFQERTRKCSSGKNDDCPGSYFEVTVCNERSCDDDGIWTQWSEWVACTVTCGGGHSVRTRACFYPDPAHKGKPCFGGNAETNVCNTNVCPVDGNWNTWNLWTSCSVTCSNGTKSRARECYFLPNEPKGNNCSGSANETLDCNLGLCPVDGVWHSWTTWSTCTVTCGNGTSSRDRVCDFPDNTPHGRNCTGSNSDARSCNELCQVDGNYTDWGSWSVCSKTCGGGSQERNRTCDYDPVAPHGNNCSLLGASSQIQACMTENCPVHGIWSPWSNYTACTVTCGGGTQARLRKCAYTPGYPQGETCAGFNNETQQCNTDLCPVDGKLSAWGSWDACSKSCANGTQSRHRTCDYSPPTAPHGKACSGSLDETIRCHTEKCPIAGQWSDWTNFTVCSVTCAGGKHTRNRTCIFDDPEAPHLSDCFGNTMDTHSCNTQPCPVDGVWGNWGSWYTCTVTCGGGQKVRDRTCDFPEGVDHGRNCTGPEHEIDQCSSDVCPVDGKFTPWSAWTQCTYSCGNGDQTRIRKCEFNGGPPGTNCTGSFSETQSCSPNPCPVDGHWSDWTQWSSCSKTCATGNITRSRNCSDPAPSNGGHQCYGLGEESDVCNLPKCPMWSSWFSGPCSVTCGQGNQVRVRHCSTGNSADCDGPASENATCHDSPCAVDGHWSEWSTWSNCDVTCASGHTHRTRNCSNPKPLYGGSDCQGDTVDTKSCTLQNCPTWSQWFTGECSVTCGDGSASLLRICSTGKDSDCSGTPFDSVACHKPAC